MRDYYVGAIVGLVIGLTLRPFIGALVDCWVYSREPRLDILSKERREMMIRDEQV